MKYRQIRRVIELHNEKDGMLQRNIYTCKKMKNRIIERWSKLYGKKFPSLIIIDKAPHPDEKFK